MEAFQISTILRFPSFEDLSEDLSKEDDFAQYGHPLNAIIALPFLVDEDVATLLSRSTSTFCCNSCTSFWVIYGSGSPGQEVSSMPVALVAWEQGRIGAAAVREREGRRRASD